MASAGKGDTKATGAVIGMADKSKLRVIVDDLHQRTTIRDDKGDEIDFTDDLKTEEAELTII